MPGCRPGCSRPSRSESPSWTGRCLPFGIRYSAGSSASRPRLECGCGACSCSHGRIHTDAGNFGDDRMVLGTAGLEQLGHAWQTAGDVACLGTFQRHTGKHVTSRTTRTGVDRQDCIHRQQIAGLTARGSFRIFAFLVLDDNAGLQISPAGWSASRSRRGW